MDTIPASTSIKRNRVGNVSDDRLSRRRIFLVDLITNRSDTLDSRNDFAMRAYELHAIECEMIARDILDPKDSRTFA